MMIVFLKIIKFIYITLVVLPLWFLTSTLNLVSCILLSFVVITRYKNGLKCRNDIKSIFKDYLNHVIEVFYFY